MSFDSIIANITKLSEDHAKISQDHASTISMMQKSMDALMKENEELKKQNKELLQGMQAHLDNIQNQIIGIFKPAPKKRKMSLDIEESFGQDEDLEPHWAGRGAKSNERKAWEERQRIKNDFPLHGDM